MKKRLPWWARGAPATTDGGWREIGEGDFRQNDNGIVVIYLERGSLPSGRYAFTSWYGKDVLHRDGYSDMSLFRVR